MEIFFESEGFGGEKEEGRILGWGYRNNVLERGAAKGLGITLTAFAGHTSVLPPATQSTH